MGKDAGTIANQGGKSRTFSFTPTRALIFLIVAIFVIEFADMFLLMSLPPLPHGVVSFIDATFLLLMLSPTYFLLYRPFRQLWDECKRSEEEIRHLSQRLIEASEAERRHVSRELHDEFGQVLTALQFSVETLGRTMPEGNPEAKNHLKRMAGLLNQLGHQVRHVSGTLRPALLDDMGLETALRSHIGQFIRLHPDIQINLSFEGRKRLFPGEVNLALFRTVQESLNNAVRHAHPRKVEIRLNYSPLMVELSVEDDGAGFDLAEVRSRNFRESGIGLLGMRERAAALGGDLLIMSARGRGTIVRAALPLPPEGVG